MVIESDTRVFPPRKPEAIGYPVGLLKAVAGGGGQRHESRQ